MAHSGEIAAAVTIRVLIRCMSAAAICDRAAMTAQTVAIASHVAAATSGSGIATGESGTTAVRFVAAAVGVKTGGSRVGGPELCV